MNAVCLARVRVASGNAAISGSSSVAEAGLVDISGGVCADAIA